MPTQITKPIRPGTTIRFRGEATPVIPPSVAETAAIPITHDWGPVNTPVLVTSFPEFEQVFGPGRTAGRTAVLGAFAGQALPGQGGAGGVFVYRMAATSGVAAGSGGTAPASLKLLAKHAGSRGNLISGVVEADPGGDALRQQFRLLVDGALVERYSYVKANPKELTDALSSRSGYVHAGMNAVVGTGGTVKAQARNTTGRTIVVSVSGASHPMDINWGDGTPHTYEAEANSGASHTYAADGANTITLTPLGGAATPITLAVTLPFAAPTALANATIALTGGADGNTLTVVDWEGATTAMEYLPFSVMAPFDVTDPAIRAFLVSWVKGQEAANRPVMVVFGGDADETPGEAISDAIAINCDHVVRLSGGYFRDDVLDATVSTSQLAPRVAGVLCSLGDTNSLTFKPMGGLSYVGTGFANDEVEQTIQSGVTTLTVSTNPDAAIRIERGLTTYVTKTDPSKPYDFFSDPRLVRLVDLFIRRMKEWGDNTMIGNVPVNDDSRTALRARARAEIQSLEDRGLTVPGTDYLDVPVPTDPDLLDSLIYEFGFQCSRTALYIFGFGVVR